MTYVLDTNTISYLLRGEGTVSVNFYNEIVIAKRLYAIPYIVAYEVRRWLEYRPTKQMILFSTHFFNLFNVVESKADIKADTWDVAVQIYIDLKQKGQLIGDADILIASYCLVKNYTLVTRNEKDFKRINNLNLVNWY